MKTTSAATVSAAGLVLCASDARAQDASLSRLVTVVKPDAPGGTTDIITRGMTEPLQRVSSRP